MEIPGLTTADGTSVVAYTYDPHGKVLTTTGTLAATLGTYNPLRYRGYVYDHETGLYYLQSRYYDPAIGRFLNADSFASTGQGIIGNNMFAYCNNNPVGCSDYSGKNTQTLQTWLSTMWWLCTVDGALPIGEVIYGLGIVILSLDFISAPAGSQQSASAVESASDLMDFASSAATPPPPNKGGKGTQVTSKTLYKKAGKNGFRIDVENPGNRLGQIHLQQGSMKYYYNIATQTFRIGSSTGPMAPKSIQDMLLLPEVIIAIGKGLEILGYGR